MYKKVFVVTLVLFGCIFSQITRECFAQFEYEREELSNSERSRLLYQYVRSNWPADEIWPQLGIVLTYIGDGNDAAAQAAVDKLLVDFSGNQYLPIALHETAKLNGLLKKQDKALILDRYVAEHWPQHEYAMWSLRDAAKFNIELGKTQEAQEDVNKVIADFQGQKYAAFALYEIAGQYKKFKNYEKARQVYQYIIDNWPVSDYAKWSQGGLEEIEVLQSDWAMTQTSINAQRDLAITYIDNDNMSAAEPVIDGLLTYLPKDPRIATAMFKIADHCRKLRKYEKAIQLYQSILSSRPQHASARWSQSGIAMCQIGLGNIQAAEAATQKLLADFPRNELMADCIYDIADAYNHFGRYEDARRFYQYALDNWPEFAYTTWAKIGLAQMKNYLGENDAAEAIIEGLAAKLSSDYPDGSDLPLRAAETYYYCAQGYRQLSRYVKSNQCCQKVIDRCPTYENAYIAQYLIGRNYESLKKTGVISESEANAKIRDAYEQLIRNYPNCSLVNYARTWIEQNN